MIGLVNSQGMESKAEKTSMGFFVLFLEKWVPMGALFSEDSKFNSREWELDNTNRVINEDILVANVEPHGVVVVFVIIFIWIASKVVSLIPFRSLVTIFMNSSFRFLSTNMDFHVRVLLANELNIS